MDGLPLYFNQFPIVSVPLYLVEPLDGQIV
jgi:hypothetical protein